MHLLPRLFKLGQGAAERCIECLARTLRVLESPLEREDLGVALGVGGECSRIELGDAALGAPDDGGGWESCVADGKNGGCGTWRV